MLPLTLTLIHLGPQAGPLNVGALLVRGTLVWDETTQAGAAEQWLCATASPNSCSNPNPNPKPNPKPNPNPNPNTNPNPNPKP